MDRKLEILMAVVDEYIRTGEPVGSRSVAATLGGNLCSATVRNEMAALCELGLLSQPHTSAGRLPTVKGYRVYINSLSAQKTQPRDKAAIERGARQAVRNRAHAKETAQLLSGLTGCAAVLLSEEPSDPICCVQVVTHGPLLHTVVVATQAGNIRSSTVRTARPPEAGQLALLTGLANEKLAGLTAAQVNLAVIQSLAALTGAALLDLMPLIEGIRDAAAQLTVQTVNVSGEERLMREPLSPEELRRLYTLFSDPAQLMQLLSIATDDSVAVSIGSEIPVQPLPSSSVLATQYGGPHKMIGKAGVIAPIRADYRTIIPKLRYFAECIGWILNQTEDENAYRE